MKTLSKLMFLLVAISLFGFSCKKKTDAKAAKTSDASGKAATAGASAATYTIKSGDVMFAGSKKIGGSHTGKIGITSGTLAMGDGKIQSGSFDINMNALSITDIKEAGEKAKLEGHLKSPDFFDAGAHPTGKFVVTGCTALAGNPKYSHKVVGDLTLKGVTKSVSFDASVKAAGNILSAVAGPFTINRTDWGIKYGSSGSFADLAADQVINDAVVININLTAGK